MSAKVIKCSNCGGPLLNISKNIQQCKCSYCGAISVLKTKGKEIITDVNKVLKRAAKYEGDGNENKAMELYDEFLQIEPNEPLVLFVRALISLIDTPEDDLNVELFQQYFDKALKAAESDMMRALDFLMYHFFNYTVPSMLVWQTYAYDKLYNIDKRSAKRRMSSNLFLLFEIQNKIINLVESTYIENPSKSYKEEYKYFQSNIVEFGNKLLSYVNLYGLSYGVIGWLKIKDCIIMAKKRYKQFLKKTN